MMGQVLYLLLAVVMGLVERFLKPPLWLSTLVFVPATLGCVWLGTELSTVLVLITGSLHEQLRLFGDLMTAISQHASPAPCATPATSRPP